MRLSVTKASPRLLSANGKFIARDGSLLYIRVVAGKVYRTAKDWSVRMITIIRSITLIHPIRYVGRDMMLLHKRKMLRSRCVIVREMSNLFLCSCRGDRHTHHTKPRPNSIGGYTRPKTSNYVLMCQSKTKRPLGKS